MRIVVIDSATSSSVVCKHHGDGDTEYMGGPAMREQIADADVVVGAFCGDLVVLRAPDGVEVVKLNVRWVGSERVPDLTPSVTEDEFHEASGLGR